MLTIQIDEKKLEQISHIEIRKKRKDMIVVVEIPKGKITKEITTEKTC